MAQKSKYLFIASMDVDPEKRDLFNEVYDIEHCPELSKVPGVGPITRFEKYLQGRQLLDATAIERIAEECEKEVLAARERFRERAVANPRGVFDYMYESLPPSHEQQKREYLARLDRKGVE